MRVYSNTAAHTYLTAAATSGATTLTVLSTTGWPTPGSDTAVGAIDYGDQTAIEVFTYTGKTSTTLTGVTRGQDGTSAVAHAAYARVWHVASAADIQNALANVATSAAALAAHEADTTSIHGVADTSVLATATTLATAVSNHAAAGDPHTGYVLESDHTLAAHDTLGLTTDALLATAVANAAAALTAHEADTTSIHGIADTSVLATATTLATAVSNHEADTTSIHGIADTSVLATATTLAAAVSAHEADTTSVHGVTDTAQIALRNATNTFSGVNTFNTQAVTVNEALIVTPSNNNSSKFGQGAATTGIVNVGAGHAAGVPLILKGVAEQSANLLEWQDVSANVLGYVNSVGGIRAGRHTVDTGMVDITGGTIASYYGGEANPRFKLDRDTGFQWGAGGATAVDTNLYRSAANVLKTDDALIIPGASPGFLSIGGTGSAIPYGGLEITAGGSKTQVHLSSTTADTGITIGADTNIYRPSANILRSDDRVDVGLDLYVRQSDATNYVGIGALGPSNEVGIKLFPDVNLYRSAANVLKTDDAFVAVGTVTAAGVTAGNLGLTAGGYIAGDSTVQLLAAAGDILYLGADADTGLIYTRRGMRFSAGKVLDWAGDTNLYRSSANVLKTDDAFIAVGSITGGSLIAPALTTSFIYGTSGVEPYLSFASNTLTAHTRAATYVGLTVKGFASQSANLQEWQSSAGTVLARVSSAGQIVAENTLYNVGDLTCTGTLIGAALTLNAQAVTLGAADSGGVGYKVLRVPN